MKFYVEFHSETGVWTGTLNQIKRLGREMGRESEVRETKGARDIS